MVGMTGFEPATSWSQTKRATNCATSRNIKLKIENGKLQILLSGHFCGQSAFYKIFAGDNNAEKVSVYKAFRRFCFRLSFCSVTRSQTKRATNCATSRNKKLKIESQNQREKLYMRYKCALI